MSKFEIRCNTERVLEVEADDEASALQIAEQTDFSDWDSADSAYSIEPLDAAGEVVQEPTTARHHHVQTVECGAETLRIDMQLFRVQRELLTTITDLARNNRPYTPAVGDEQLLNGLLELTDALVDANEPDDR